VAAAEMALAGGCGVEIHLKKVPIADVNRNDFVLFSESNSRFLVEVSEEAKEEFEALTKGKACAEIGRVTKTRQLCVRGLNGKAIVDASLDDLSASWKRTFGGGI
jgi:phosphoribosylformylglycinamidine synthase